MGGVKCLTPASAVLTSTAVQRIVDVSSSSNAGGTIPIKTYRKPTNMSGMQNIIAKASISCDTYQPVTAKHARQ